MTTSPDGARIAYFISSYRSSDQLRRLIKVLRRARPSVAIVIHHDVFQSAFDTSLLEMGNVHVVTSEIPIVWGDFSLEAARWRVFRWAIAHLDFEWLVLLSEQDYPLRPLREFEDRLAASNADAIISGETLDQINDRQLRREVTARYMYQYRMMPSLGVERRLPDWIRNALTSIRRALIAAVNHGVPGVFIHTTPRELHLSSQLGRRAAQTPFSEDFPCWFHDSWFVLSRKAVENVVSFVDDHPEFAGYYSRTIIPVESATGTIVFNDPELRVENATLTATVWSKPKSGRPDVITSENLPQVLSSGSFFARKFDTASFEVLDELDRVIFNDAQK